MNVAPQTVSGRVVNTSIGSPDSVRKTRSAPSERPIQLRCIVLTRSGQSTVFRPSINSSAYFVMPKYHCSRSRL